MVIVVVVVVVVVIAAVIFMCCSFADGFVTHFSSDYFSFQPVLHDWCNKYRGMCYPVCGVVHI